MPSHAPTVLQGLHQTPKSTAAAATASNLGALQSLAEPEAAGAAAQAQAFAASSDAVHFTGGGVINVDGGAIASSLVLLVLLLALSLNRILGLERLLG